jgi:molybdopterin molybdotransferase
VTSGDGELIDEIEDVLADLIVTTGPGAGAAVRRVLPGLNAEILVDGVECTPGASALLARLSDGRYLVHCGEIPIDAVASLLMLLAPIIESMSGRPDPARRSRTTRMVVGDRTNTHLLAVRYVGDRSQEVEVVTPGGPGGLFALSAADALMVVPPGGVATNEPVTVLPMP